MHKSLTTKNWKIWKKDLAIYLRYVTVTRDKPFSALDSVGWASDGPRPYKLPPQQSPNVSYLENLQENPSTICCSENLANLLQMP